MREEQWILSISELQWGFQHCPLQDPHRNAVDMHSGWADSEVAWNPAEWLSQRVVISGLWSSSRPVTSSDPKGQYWVQSSAASSLMNLMIEQSVPLASLQVTPNWKEWLIPQKVMLPSSVSWRNGLTGTSWCSTRGTARSCTWGRTTPSSSTL